MDDFKRKDTITDFSDMDESYLKISQGQFRNVIGVPEVTCSIRINTDLRVQLFHKESPVPLLIFFKKGRNSKLTSKSMLQNFPSYIK